MGSCCCAPAAPDSPGASGGELVIDHKFDGSGKDAVLPLAAGAAVPGGDFSDFARRLCRGTQVMVVPAAKTGIMCQLFFDAAGRRFILKKDHLTRAVALNTVQRVMHLARDLNRVQNAALADDPLCCALLLKSYTCIGLRWADAAEKEAFVNFVDHLLAGGM